MISPIIEQLKISKESYQRLPSIVNPLLEWFFKEARVLPWRDNPDPYYVWVSEIMLQQTRVQAVLGYFSRFIAEVPTIKRLSEIPDERLLKLWEGLGYYNRARNLKKTSIKLMQEYKGQLPRNYELLKTLPGIGEYTAGAIASIAFEIAVPAVDGNVYRVLARLLASDEVIKSSSVKKAYFQIVRQIIPTEKPGAFNQALMELGATVCIPRGIPLCDICPVNSLCEGKRQNIQQELPVLPVIKKRRVEQRTILIVQSPQGVLLCRRNGKGVLSGLWEPINLEGHLVQTEINTFLAKKNITVKKLKKLGEAKHIFSHLEWHMEAWYITTLRGDSSENLLWTDDLSLYSIPSAFQPYRKFLEKAASSSKIENH